MGKLCPTNCAMCQNFLSECIEEGNGNTCFSGLKSHPKILQRVCRKHKWWLPWSLFSRQLYCWVMIISTSNITWYCILYVIGRMKVRTFSVFNGRLGDDDSPTSWLRWLCCKYSITVSPFYTCAKAWTVTFTYMTYIKVLPKRKQWRPWSNCSFRLYRACRTNSG